MKTNVSDTSINAYDALKSDGLTDRQALIVNAMEQGKVYTRRQLSVMTGMETSGMAGRCNELEKDGVIQVVGKVDCPITGIRVEAISLAPKQLEFSE